MLSLNTGTLSIAPLKVIQTLFGHGDFESATVLYDYRMPRIIITMLAGIGLGISGAILQGLSRNALADPGILGLHSGASFGLIIFVTFFHSINENASILIPLFTFGGGVLAAFLIIILASDRSKGLLPIRLILVGIAVSAGFSAISLFFSLKLNDETYTFASRWLVGNVWGRDWIHVLALLPWIFILTPYAWLKSKTLNALSLGDSVAAGLGVSVQKRTVTTFSYSGWIILRECIDGRRDWFYRFSCSAYCKKVSRYYVSTFPSTSWHYRNDYFSASRYDRSFYI